MFCLSESENEGAADSAKRSECVKSNESEICGWMPAVPLITRRTTDKDTPNIFVSSSFVRRHADGRSMAG